MGGHTQVVEVDEPAGEAKTDPVATLRWPSSAFPWPRATRVPAAHTPQLFGPPLSRPASTSAAGAPPSHSLEPLKLLLLLGLDMSLLLGLLLLGLLCLE